MTEGPLSKSYYQRFNTVKENGNMEIHSCGETYNHDSHLWRWEQGSGNDYNCPGFPIQDEKEAVPMEDIPSVQYNGYQQHTGEVRMTDDWCDAKMRAVALELAIAFGKGRGENRDTILRHFDAFFRAIAGEGRDKDTQSRTESDL
jgi:hypothetical protein